MPAKPDVSSAASPSSLWLNCIIAAIIVALVLAAYLPAMGAKFIWDDNWLLANNDRMRNLRGLGAFWAMNWRDKGDIPDYYPVTWSSFWIEWQLWRDNPQGYHVANILLHAASALLLWRVLAAMGWRWAWAAAMIFAVHPVNVASVAWIAERKNTLSMLFFLLSILLFIRFDKGRRRLFYGLSLAMFLLAMLSKTSVAMLPVVLLLVIFLRRGKVGGWDLLAVAPFFIVAAGLSVVGVLYQINSVIRDAPIRGGDENFFFRLASAGIAPWFYLLKIVVPYKLAMVYPRWQIEAKNILYYLPGLALVGLCVLFWWRRKGWGKPAFAALAYFVVTLFPVLGFFDMYYLVYSFVADHWQYVPMIGAIAGVVGVADFALRRLSKVLPIAAAAVVIAGLAVMTYQRSKIFANSTTLWRDNIAKYPSHFLPYFNLGKALDDEGLNQEALDNYRLSLGRKVDFDRPYVNIGRILASRGEAAQKAGNPGATAAFYSEAAYNFSRAVAYYSRSVTALMNLGAMLHLLGRSPEGLQQLLKAEEIQPDSAEIQSNLVVVLSAMGRIDEAIDHARKAVKANPDDSAMHVTLIKFLAQRERTDEAIEEARQLLRRAPDNAEAHYFLALQLRTRGDRAGAVEHFRSVLVLQPRNIDAWNNLGITLIESGNLPAGIEHLRHALSIQPQSPDIMSNLAFALSTSGQVEEAITLYRQALKIRPDRPNTLNSLAWILAAPTRSPEDAKEALQLAQRAIELSNPPPPQMLETLAVAQARNGHLAEAIETAKRAEESAKAAGNAGLAAAIAKRIEGWSASQPASK